MSSSGLQNWVDNELSGQFPETFDIQQLKQIIQKKNITGKKIIEGEFYCQSLINELKGENAINEAVSDVFFKSVRKRQKLEKKKSSQLTIVLDAFNTIFWYHIGTASFAALAACVGIFDVWPIVKSIVTKCYQYCKRCKCCKDDTEPSKIDSPKADEYTSIEMTTFDKELMYEDYQKTIFPLIKERILNLSKEYMLKAAVQQTMENITKKHYSTAHGAEENQNNAGNKEDTNIVEEIKYDQDDTNENETNKKQTTTVKDEPQHIISEISKNIDTFIQEDYENEIKEDIEKIIEREIEKLKKQLKKKKAQKEKRKRAETADFEKDRTGTQIASEGGKDGKYNRMRKEGLIFTSLYGTSFCLSSYGASKLEKDNITRLAGVEGFSTYNERFGRIGIASFNTSIIVIIMFVQDLIYDHISSFIMPSLIVWMVSYAIGSIFTMVLEVTVGTLLFCVILNEDKWKELFAINQGKIKQNVSGLTNGLAAMITEHQLVMQLKETEVDKKILDMSRKYVAGKKDEDNLSSEEIKMLDQISKKLFEAKRKALITEKKLLEEIDGTMKLTQYLIDVILVENYFNKQYKKHKAQQEIGRDSVEHIFKKEKYESISRKQIKEDLYEKVRGYPQIKSFLYFYSTSEGKDKQLEAWKETVKSLENKLKGNGIRNFKMTGAKKKGIERAFYKSFYSYHTLDDGFRYLTDILRCSFVFSDFINLYKAFQCIYGMKKEFEVLRVKDRFNTASEPCGYRDFMINVLVKNQTDMEGIICEIQLHHKTFYNAKRVSHRMYKKTRLFEKDNGNEAYKYAVKYVRPVIGRFKVYPMDQEEDKIDILEIIGGKIEKLAVKYCKNNVIKNFDTNTIINLDTRKYGMSVLATLPDNNNDSKAAKNEEQRLSFVEEQQEEQQIEEEQPANNYQQ